MKCLARQGTVHLCRRLAQLPLSSFKSAIAPSDLLECRLLIAPSSSLITDVTGFVAVDSTNRKIVVSFRGSSSVRNWLANVDFNVMPTDLCDGCTVHQGFWRSWLEARPGILAAVQEAVSRNPGYGIVCTGHSLGGALATLSAATLRNNGYDVALVSQGSSARPVMCADSGASIPMVLPRSESKLLPTMSPTSQEAITVSPTQMTSCPSCRASYLDIDTSAPSIT